MNTPHKYAELIKAWADGAEIEVRNVDFGSANVGPEWTRTPTPNWYTYLQYRIKPEPVYPKSSLPFELMYGLLFETSTIYHCDIYKPRFQVIADAAVKQYIIENNIKV